MDWRVLPAVLAAVLPACGDGIEGIGPAGEVKKLHTGFRFTEGPAADAEGNVFFSDIPNARILKVDAQGKLSVFVEGSGRSNGLMINGKGELVGCTQEKGEVVAFARDGKSRRVLAGTYEGKRFNAPNDLVIDKAGGIYFTDPHYGGPAGTMPQGVRAVYHVAPAGKVTRLATPEGVPNGIILSPDEKTLYVVPSQAETVYAWPVEAPGKLGKRRLFARLKQWPNKSNKGGDGLTVDTKGNLYITTGLGLQVFSPAGELLGIIEIPERPANVTFGGKGKKTLYVTARTSLYTVPMHAQGHAFPAGK